MKSAESSWRQINWRCTTCGLQGAGYEDSEKRVKIECRRCHTVMIRTACGRRHSRMEIYEPKEGWNPTVLPVNRTLRTWDTTE